MNHFMKAAFLAVLALSLIPMMAEAALLIFSLDTEFSGGTPPAGSTPWLTATFDDSVGGPNTVRLTMSTSGLVGTESVKVWMFNFNPTEDPTQLSFALVGTPGSTPNAINTGVNAFQADGDGLFDIQFDFPPSPGDFASRFTTGETVVYDITYTSAIDFSSFDFGSALGGGQGTFRTAAQIQSIGALGQSGWIGPGGPGGGGNGVIPEPSTIILLSLGLLCLAGISRRKMKK